MRKLIAVAGLGLLGLWSTAAQALPCAGFTDVEDTSPFCGNVTWLKNRSITLGCAPGLYCPNDFVSRLQMAAFMNRLGDSLFPLTCAAGQVMKWDGLQWACANDAIGGGGGGGTVTSVAAGTGLQGSPNPITGAGSINLAPTYQLPQACTNGQVPKSNGAGGWACGTDIAGAGTMTSLSQGTGITLSANPITTAGSIAVNTTTIQARVTGTCAAGSSIRIIAADGSVTCQADSTGPATAFVLGGNAFAAEAVLGTVDAFALNLHANGSRVMRYEPNGISPNVIAGSAANNVTSGVRGATIGGGGVPAGNTDPDFAAEAPNRVTDAYGTVGGGYANRAGDDAGTTVDRPFATVGGGWNNVATGTGSTTSGGYSNTARGFSSVVGGGTGNTATGPGSVVGGGGYDGSTAAGNVVNGAASTIAGGYGNLIAIDGLYASIGGGAGNQIAASPGTSLWFATVGGGVNNVVSVDGATISGGSSNAAAGDSSTIGGGESNSTGGIASTVPGGSHNSASGPYSFAAGRRAKALADGVVLFSDSTDADFTGIDPNVFAVGFTGGIGMWTSKTFATGCSIPAGGGAWNCTSSRDQKQDFATVDAQAVLQRVAALPITEWRYRTETSGARHMGPTAQDFHAAFGLGDSDKSIGLIDANGVALAAIQGLNLKVEEQRAALREREVEIRALRDEVAALRDTRDDVAVLKATLLELLRANAAVPLRVGFPATPGR